MKAIPRVLARLLINIASWPLYAFSIISLRDKNVWVFGSWFGHRYTDNSRYLFEFVSSNCPDIRSVWLTRDVEIVNHLRAEGREAYPTASLRGFLIACRAGVSVLTGGERDVNAIAISKSKRVVLFHGTPLKKIKHDDKLHEHAGRPMWFRVLRGAYRSVFPFLRERWDLIISTSETVSRRLVSAFQVPEAQVVVTGSPRGDIILRRPPQPSSVIERLRSERGYKRIILYAPTHRLEGRGEADFIAQLPFEKCRALLNHYGAALLIKAHFYHRDAPGSDGELVAPIHRLSEADAPDINVLLPHTDILITDYSSVFYDFLLLDRPIIFAPFDLTTYLTEDRELYEPYETATPGPKCHSWDDVLIALRSVLSGQDEYVRERRSVRARTNAFVDTNNCARIVRAVKAIA